MRITRETFALWHAGLLVAASAWLLGGKIDWAKPVLALLATPALALLAWEISVRRREVPGSLRRLAFWLAPMTVLAAIIVSSALNPSHVRIQFFDTELLRPIAHRSGLPSSADPAGSLLELWLLGGLYLTGFNLAFCVQSRRRLRRLLLALVVNAALLAILGSLQTFTGAGGPYFGRFTTGNPAWFSTFSYHNHWGAFATLHVAAALALAAHAARQAWQSTGRPFGRSIGPAVLCCAAIIALGAPLSTSRSSTVMIGLLLLAAALAGLRLIRRAASVEGRRWHRRTLVVAVIAIGIAAFALHEFAGHNIRSRWRDTLSQYDELRTGSVNYGRAELYRDTWHLARDNLAWGVGLETYALTFLPYYTFTPTADRLRPYYDEAHNDWLQSLAEIGLAGSALLLLAFAIPFIDTVRAHRIRDGLGAFLFGGCGLIAMYSFFEFPFASPAVVAAWWCLFFVALRHRQLSQS